MALFDGFQPSAANVGSSTEYAVLRERVYEGLEGDDLGTVVRQFARDTLQVCVMACHDLQHRRRSRERACHDISTVAAGNFRVIGVGLCALADPPVVVHWATVSGGTQNRRRHRFHVSVGGQFADNTGFSASRHIRGARCVGAKACEAIWLSGQQ